MGQIGDVLRIQREKKGLSLREVEEATKIRMKYLIAMEADDFDALPGKAYVIGFLRTYARFLGINDEELVHSLKSLPQYEVQEEEIVEKVKPAPRNSRALSLIMIIILALVIGGIVLAFFRDKGEEGPPNNDTPPQVQTPQEGENPPDDNAPVLPDTEDPTALEPDTSGVSVTVIVREDNCWIGVTIDGQNDFQGTLKAGESRTFTGQGSIKIKYGNAGVVEVIANGEQVYPLGNIGQVITREYTEN